MANRFQTPSVQFVDFNGRPLSFGQVFFYYSKTSTPLDTYSNQALSIVNPNPITLDAYGRAGAIFLGALAYKVVLTDSRGDQVWTEDPVIRQSSVTGAGGNLTGVINFAMGASVAADTIGPTPPPAPIYLPPGTTFWVPDTSGTVTIGLWGSGSDGSTLFGAGSGAGAYAEQTGVIVTGGVPILVNIPFGNSGTGVGATDNNYTWWGSITTYRANCAYPSNSGSASQSIGAVKYDGGPAGTGVGGGGGGAAGPLGAGARGGNNSNGFVGSGGGGGSNGGTAGADIAGGTSGGDGGHNHAGQSGGSGGVGTDGFAATHPGSGGGGAANGFGTGNYYAGGTGADDKDNGGGGGGGGDAQGPPTTTAHGGAGGFPGGGGGGGGGGVPGAGAGGQIKITPA